MRSTCKFHFSTKSAPCPCIFGCKTSFVGFRKAADIPEISGYLRGWSCLLTEDSQQKISLLVLPKGAWDDEVAAWKELMTTHHLSHVAKSGRFSDGRVVSEEVDILRPHVNMGNLNK